MMFWRNHTSL